MLEEELRVAVEATRAAGDAVAKLRKAGLRYGRKDGWELVSEADILAAEMLHDALTRPFPDIGWLSEEHTDNAERLGCERTWIVDPIDGTREYLQGIPEYAVSVGLAIGGQAALGVVYNPAKGSLQAAVCVDAREKPAIHLTERYDVLVGRGEHQQDEVPPLPSGARARGIGSVAYRLALLAGGEGQAVLTGYGRSEWDVAAGAALCLAAGLRVTDILGAPLRFNQSEPEIRGLLVAAPAVHEHFRQHFARLRRR